MPPIRPHLSQANYGAYPPSLAAHTRPKQARYCCIYSAATAQESAPPIETSQQPPREEPSSSTAGTATALPPLAPRPPPQARWRDSLTNRLANLSPFAFSFFERQQQQQQQQTRHPQQRPTTPRPPAARLWNPQNFSPRSLAVPNVPVEHPDIATGGKRPITAEQGREEYPLLTLPEQRRSRQSLQASSSLKVERSSGNYSDRGSVGLPENRRSLQYQRGQGQGQSPIEKRENEEPVAESSRAAEERSRARAILESGPMPPNEENRQNGHGGADQGPLPFVSHDDKDLESGKGPLRGLNHSTSRASLPLTGRVQQQQAADATAGAEQGRPSTAPEEGEEAFPWGPSHPCFPHLNPHVPLSSQEYQDTRIIRVRRDWMQVGDLAPTFANLYPEILDPLISEEEFRRVVQYVNSELIAAFTPWSVRAWVDAALGLATLWLWDDLGLAGVKRRLSNLEAWIERWNRDVGSQEGIRIIPLRRTAYMTLDFQIPDPHISLDTNTQASRPNTDDRATTPAHPPPTGGDYGPFPINVTPQHGDGQQHMPQGVALEAR